jgi:hypothetical protein
MQVFLFILVINVVKVYLILLIMFINLVTANIERPKVIYNAATGLYVMWMHKENGVDYSEARAAVAYSTTIDGNYTWQGSFQPQGLYMSRDDTLFVDDDGSAYFVSSARENLDTHVY